MEAWTRLHKWPQAPLPPGHCRPHLSCGTTPPPQTVGFSPCSHLSTSPWTSKSWASEPQLAPSWCLLTPPSLSRSPCICCQLPSSPRVPPQIPEMGLMQNGSSWHPVPVGKKFAPQGSLPMLAGPFLVSPCCPTEGRRGGRESRQASRDGKRSQPRAVGRFLGLPPGHSSCPYL